MSSRTFFGVALICGLSACGLAGCGYQQSGVYDRDTAPGYKWHSLYREDVQTVAVPTFINRSYYRGLEIELSKAVIQQMEAHTPYKVVSAQRADTILEGEIVSVRVNTISKDSRAGIPQDQLLDIVVDFTWKDLKSGRILVSRRGLEQTSSFYATLGEGRATGTQIATEKLAIAIVQELESDW